MHSQRPPCTVHLKGALAATRKRQVALERCAGGNRSACRFAPRASLVFRSSPSPPIFRSSPHSSPLAAGHLRVDDGLKVCKLLPRRFYLLVRKPQAHGAPNGRHEVGCLGNSVNVPQVCSLVIINVHLPNGISVDKTSKKV